MPSERCATWVVILLLTWLVSARASADDEGVGAPKMAASSWTLLVGGQVSPSTAPFQLGADLSLRIVPAEGVYVTPRLGASGSGTPAGAAWGWLLHVGVGVGWITAVGREVAFTLGVGYDLLLLGSLDVWLPIQRVVAELSLPVVLGSAVIEPYLHMGVQLVDDGPDGVLALGLRAGVTW